MALTTLHNHHVSLFNLFGFLFLSGRTCEEEEQGTLWGYWRREIAEQSEAISLSDSRTIHHLYRCPCALLAAPGVRYMQARRQERGRGLEAHPPRLPILRRSSQITVIT